ncbi:unnamed protein product [Auanema sp. JU1783]|nr:unnamed protein product [Auanema sp. JU1783]
MLTDIGFLSGLVYGLISMAAYTFLLIVIIRNWKEFKNSFYVLYIVSSFLNMGHYFNQLFIYKMPQYTCFGCVMSHFYKMQTFFGMAFFHFLYTHLILVQYNMILLTSLNRFTMIFFPFSVERIWSTQFTTKCIILAIILPVTADYTLIGGTSKFIYQINLDNFDPRSSAYENSLFTRCAIYMAVITLVALIINVASVTRLVMYKSNVTKKSEVNLLIMTLCNFFFQLLLTTLVVMGNFADDHNDRHSIISVLYVELEPYLTDCLSLLSPFFLYLSSSKLRHFINQNIKPNTFSLPSYHTK